LNAILRLKGKREIVSVTHLRPTVHLRTPKKGKKITRFDIHARTRDGRFIDIEMQRAWHDDFLDRIELYSAGITARNSAFSGTRIWESGSPCLFTPKKDIL